MAYFDSEILAALNWLSALMAIDCLLPAVFNEMLELKPAAWAITWKLPLAPRPWMLPPILIVVSLVLNPCVLLSTRLRSSGRRR